MEGMAAAYVLQVRGLRNSNVNRNAHRHRYTDKHNTHTRTGLCSLMYPCIQQEGKASLPCGSGGGRDTVPGASPSLQLCTTRAKLNQGSGVSGSGYGDVGTNPLVSCH